VRKVPSIKAFHGSPHDFDEFSMDQIGTGEGAQAYGHGLYFAESEDVARGYRQAGSTFTPADGSLPRYATYKGKPAHKADTDLLGQKAINYFDDLKHYADDDPKKAARMIRETYSDNIKKSASSDKKMLEDIFADDPLGLLSQEGPIPKSEELQIADWLDANADDLKIRDKGSMYQVEIDASPDEFLDWDLPLSEQSDLVRKNMETLGFTDNKKAVNDFDNALLDNLFNDSSKPLPKQPSDLRGEHLYYQSAPKATNPAEASKALSGLGIKGIRYKDGFSRGADGGTSNYVIFDDRLISIAKKYGIAIPAAAALLSQETGLNPISLYEEENPV
jgi:hypothetical protein